MEGAGALVGATSTVEAWARIPARLADAWAFVAGYGKRTVSNLGSAHMPGAAAAVVGQEREKKQHRTAGHSVPAAAAVKEREKTRHRTAGHSVPAAAAVTQHRTAGHGVLAAAAVKAPSTGMEWTKSQKKRDKKKQKKNTDA